MDTDPYCGENEGHQCSYSPTGRCRADIDACAKATGCVMPQTQDSSPCQ